MNFIAVVRHDPETGKVTKYMDFEVEADAQAHVSTYGGFVARKPETGSMDDWRVQPDNTLLYVEPSADPAEVTAYAEQLIADGATMNIAGHDTPVFVRGSEKDARNLESLYGRADRRERRGETGVMTTYRDGNNVFFQMNPAQIIQMYELSAAYAESVYAVSWQLKLAGNIPMDFRESAPWPNPDLTV